MAELSVALAKVIYAFDLELDPKSADRYKERCLYAMWDCKPLHLKLTPVAENRKDSNGHV